MFVGQALSPPGPVAHPFTSNPGHPFALASPALAPRCEPLNLAFYVAAVALSSGSQAFVASIFPTYLPDCEILNSFKKDERAGGMAQWVEA